MTPPNVSSWHLCTMYKFIPSIYQFSYRKKKDTFVTGMGNLSRPAGQILHLLQVVGSLVLQINAVTQITLFSQHFVSMNCASKQVFLRVYSFYVHPI